MPAADAQQLRALVSTVRRTDDRSLAIAVRADPVWTDAPVLDGDVPVTVKACGSPLAVRAALAEHERTGGDTTLVMLTNCGDSELGPDVMARLVKGRVVSLDPFAAVLGLFRATILDPALTRQERWLVDDLIALAPSGGWPNERLIANVLDIDTAWRVWHAARLGVSKPPETLTEVLALAEMPGIAARLGALSQQQRTSLAGRWAGGAAPVGVLIEVIAGGRNADLVPLGLVAGVLWAPTDSAATAQDQVLGRVRLESVLGRDTLDARSARMWADTAAAALNGAGAAPLWIDRAEQTLVDAGVAGLAVLSDHLPSGFELRLDLLAAHLSAGRADDAAVVLDDLQRHRQGGRRTRRMSAASAAVRLLRRPAVTPRTSMQAFVQGYADDGAWVEEARRLLAEGDQRPALATAFTAICGAVVDEQRSIDREFAQRLAEWSASEPQPEPSIVPVEQLLDRVVVPIAMAMPVLVLVCDGMALPVAHELLRDVADEGWAPAAPSGTGPWPLGVAMLPTVTEVSRASLLAGKRVEGTQAAERDGFTMHAGLRTASAGQKAPVLFHKSQLVGPAGVALSDEVRSAITDTSQRVVGIVVNSVDDHLSRGDQVRVEWTLESLGPLPWILDAAAEAGRVVVLTADHGHVLHGEGSVLRQHTDGGERWRPTGAPVADDEVEVHGPRVLKGGRVVLPVDDRIRYAGFKHGYHGGASLHEVVVPVTVLARSLPDGWERRPLTPPTWWSGDTAASPAVAAPLPVRQAKKQTVGQVELFTPEHVATGGTWVDALLTSPTFVAQRERARLPRPIADDRLVRYLSAIHSNGGTIELAALSSKLGEPADQLRMALTLVQRLVNIDGSEILAVRGAATVELNAELLRLQFEVAVP
jgi:hypothetical protein